MVHPQPCPLPVPLDPGDEPVLPHPGHQPGAEEKNLAAEAPGDGLTAPHQHLQSRQSSTSPVDEGTCSPPSRLPCTLGLGGHGWSRPLPFATRETTHDAQQEAAGDQSDTAHCGWTWGDER